MNGQEGCRITPRSLLAIVWIATDAFAGCAGWLDELDRLGYWERLAEIRAVSDLPKTGQWERVPALAYLLDHDDSSVRIVAAEEIGEIQDVADAALPQLIGNFRTPNGEEAVTYIDVVVRFGQRALPALRQALASSEPLVRARACDALRRLSPAQGSGDGCWSE